MTTRLPLVAALAAALAAAVLLPTCADAQKSKAPRPKEVWTSVTDADLPADYKFQGEYASDEAKLGVQVIALGKGAFQAVVLAGGLPGAGFDGKTKSLLAGSLSDGKLALTAATGKRRYLAQKPDEFSATSKPTTGPAYPSADCTGEAFVLKTTDGKEITLKKVTRVSPTMGAKPPEGATVLFDGTDTAKWKGGRLDKTTKLLNTDGNDIRTKEKYSDYTMHVEFLLPYRPEARGQGRGNSGFYQVDMYEMQILDSFGLDGKNNECGGIYTIAEPKVNACLPPLVWQTYDVTFTNAVADESGKKTKNARITAKLNGIVIHDETDIKGKTGGARGDKEGTPGAVQLQGHGNPLQFRNVWIVPKK